MKQIIKPSLIIKIMRKINTIKRFLNRYNPREITRLLKCIEKEIYNINKVIGIIRNNEVKEPFKVLEDRIDNNFDELPHFELRE